MNVSHVSDGVRQPEHINFRSIEGRRFLIMLQGGIGAMQVSLNLGQPGQCLRQLNWSAHPATQINRLKQVSVGIMVPVFSSRL